MSSTSSTSTAPPGTGLVLGPPWRGRTTARTAAGELVAVERVTHPPNDRRGVHARAERLVGLAGDGLARVRAVHDPGADEGSGTLVVTDLVAGPRLSDVAVAHGGMSADGVRRLLRDVAAALAALHARGLSHGWLDAEAIVLRPGGAVLTDLMAGALGVRGPGATLAPERRGRGGVAATAASDVWELAAVVAHVLAVGTRTAAHDLGDDVARLLESASAVDPGARPSATRIARELEARVSAEPGVWGRVAPDVWRIDDAVADAEREVVLLAPPLVGRRRPGAWRVGRRAGAVVATVLGLAAIVGLVASGPGPWGPPSEATVDGVPAVAAGPAAAFERRDRALRTGDVALLARAVEPGGAGWERDLATIGALRRDGVVLAGVRTLVLPAGTTEEPGAVRLAQAPHRRTVGGATALLGPVSPSCVVVRVRPDRVGARLVDWRPCAAP